MAVRSCGRQWFTLVYGWQWRADSIPDGLPLFLMRMCFIVICSFCVLCCFAVVRAWWVPLQHHWCPSNRQRRNASGCCAQNFLVTFQRLPAVRLCDSSKYLVARTQSMGWDLLSPSRRVQVPSLMTLMCRLWYYHAIAAFPPRSSMVIPHHTALHFLHFFLFHVLINHHKDHQMPVEVLLVSDHWRSKILRHICPDTVFFSVGGIWLIASEEFQQHLALAS